MQPRELLLVLNQYAHAPTRDIREVATELRDDFGFDLVPLRADKRPFQKGWTTADALPLDHPSTAMVGLRLGRFTGGLCVIDVDVKGQPDPATGITKSLQTFRDLLRAHPTLAELIETTGFCVETPSGGWHFYFIGRPDWKSVAQPIELKTNATQVVIPPSCSTKGQYRVMRIVRMTDEGPTLAPTSADDWSGSIPDLPVAIYEAIHRLKNPRRNPLAVASISGSEVGFCFPSRASAERRYETLLSDLRSAANGERWTTLQRLAPALFEFRDLLDRDIATDIRSASAADPQEIDRIISWASSKSNKRMARVRPLSPAMERIHARLKGTRK